MARWAAQPAARLGQVVPVPFAHRQEALRRLDRPATAPGALPNGPQARLVQMLRAPAQVLACHLAEAGAARREFVLVWDLRVWASVAEELDAQVRRACLRPAPGAQATR